MAIFNLTFSSPVSHARKTSEKSGVFFFAGAPKWETGLFKVPSCFVPFVGLKLTFMSSTENSTNTSIDKWTLKMARQKKTGALSDYRNTASVFCITEVICMIRLLYSHKRENPLYTEVLRTF